MLVQHALLYPGHNAEPCPKRKTVSQGGNGQTPEQKKLTSMVRPPARLSSSVCLLQQQQVTVGRSSRKQVCRA
jgi:hypothetical protein